MPDQKKEEFKRLVDKYLNGTATNAEHEAIDRYFLLFVEEPEYSRLLNKNQLAALEQRLEIGLFNKIKTPVKVKRLWPRIAAAASIILGLFTSGYFILHNRGIQQLAQTNKYDLAPGNKNAVLKTGSGRSIILSNAVTGTIAHLGGVMISKTGSGVITFTGNKSALLNSGKIVYDTLINPAGSKIYHLNLSDGSTLLVNAATKLYFPENFSHNRKITIINGEAFFKVVHNSKYPFSVLVKGQTITDLGTHFNVCAYDNEPNSVVTLLEGGIRLNKGTKEVNLIPGQQAVIPVHSTLIDVESVDTEDAVAWTTGNFMFDGDNLGEVMKKLARWYDVVVVFEDSNQANQVIGGGITMYTNMSKVLEALQKASNVHFKIDGRKITVLK